MTTTMPTHRSSATVDGVEITRKRDTRGALLTVVTWILALGFFFPDLLLAGLRRLYSQILPRYQRYRGSELRL